MLLDQDVQYAVTPFMLQLIPAALKSFAQLFRCLK